MLAKPWCDHEDSAILPFAETDIAAVHSASDAQIFFLLVSRDEEVEAFRSLSSWNPGGGMSENSTFRKTGEGKSIPKRQRPTEVNTVFAMLQVVTAELRVLQHQPKNPKSETMTSTPDDAELVKDLRGVGKPHLFDGNDADVEFLPCV